ncbi:MAG TPA: T9SS type A sorting domain-containing protein [Candidatus Kapabacteria bacterium]|nr:T9SS type A sorting domain-containing protein [Candidatus Kapabacteria bacterium]
MKRLFIVCLIVLAVQAKAQEFSLHMGYYVNGANLPNRTVIFGFDPSASDSLTDGAKWFDTEFAGGEQEYPSDPFGDIDCRWGGQVINRPYLGTGGPIDIRRRPAGESFQLPFELDIKYFGATSVKISWNKALIPPIIKHIFLSSGIFPNRPRLDLVSESEFNLPIKDSSGLYDRMIFTILYNQDKLAVGAGNTISNEVQLYPTILSPSSTISAWLETNRDITVTVKNLFGQSVFTNSINAHSGANIIHQGSLHLSNGVYIAEVIDSHTGEVLTRQKLIVE